MEGMTKYRGLMEMLGLEVRLCVPGYWLSRLKKASEGFRTKVFLNYY